MAGFTKFNPRRFLECEERTLTPAKPANAAKDGHEGSEGLAGLAALAASQPENRGASLLLVLDATGLRDRYEAAICEFKGHEDRARAEARAWNDVASIWYRQHGERTPRPLCAGCGLLIGSSNV